MSIKGWKFYNHAAVPTCAPHELPDLAPLKDGSIWRPGNLSKGTRMPLLATYIENFDQNIQTAYWYVIKDAPFCIENLDKKYQKNIKCSLRRCEVKQINPCDFLEELYDVYAAAFRNYHEAANEQPKEKVIEGFLKDTCEYWAAFNRETGEMAGWMSCRNNGDWTDTVSAKYHPRRQICRPSDALHYTILTHYLNELGQKYVNSGTRNINHKTNVQDYKEKNWKFRRAYCKLRIVYNPKIGWIIRFIFPFRKFLKLFDKITIVHQVNSLLKMEEIAKER